MEFTLSKHAADVIRERGIRTDWLDETLSRPALSEPDMEDPNLTHVLLPIADFDNRVLRVVYNHTKQPIHVVTVYFDRAMKGKL